MQVKLSPTLYWYSALDLFVAQKLATNWYVGIGAELAILTPGVYIVATTYLRKNLYLSVTPRFLKLRNGSASNDESLFNPQIALGLEGALNLSVFASYAHATGPGFNFGPDRDDTQYYVKRFTIFGLAARY